MAHALPCGTQEIGTGSESSWLTRTVFALARRPCVVGYVLPGRDLSQVRVCAPPHCTAFPVCRSIDRADVSVRRSCRCSTW